MFVYVRDGERIDQALRKFKKAVAMAGIFGDLKRHRHYVKPSMARRLKERFAEQRRRKDAARTAHKKKGDNHGA